MSCGHLAKVGRPRATCPRYSSFGSWRSHAVAVYRGSEEDLDQDSALLQSPTSVLTSLSQVQLPSCCCCRLRFPGVLPVVRQVTCQSEISASDCHPLFNHAFGFHLARLSATFPVCSAVQSGLVGYGDGHLGCIPSSALHVMAVLLLQAVFPCRFVRSSAGYVPVRPHCV